MVSLPIMDLITPSGPARYLIAEVDERPEVKTAAGRLLKGPGEHHRIHLGDGGGLSPPDSRFGWSLSQRRVVHRGRPSDQEGYPKKMFR